MMKYITLEACIILCDNILNFLFFLLLFFWTQAGFAAQGAESGTSFNDINLQEKVNTVGTTCPLCSVYTFWQKCDLKQSQFLKLQCWISFICVLYWFTLLLFSENYFHPCNLTNHRFVNFRTGQTTMRKSRSRSEYTRSHTSSKSADVIVWLVSERGKWTLRPNRPLSWHQRTLQMLRWHGLVEDEH